MLEKLSKVSPTTKAHAMTTATSGGVMIQPRQFRYEHQRGGNDADTAISQPVPIAEKISNPPNTNSRM